jgi:HAD superfamily hydrolase (TIGR01509 family)
MTLLLLDLDDTLVDRGRIFDQWLADFTRPHEVSDQDLTWITALDGGGYTEREEFFGGVVQRLGLSATVPDLVDEWTHDFPARYRCDPGVREELLDARARGWSLGVVTNGDAQVQGRKITSAGLDELVDAVCISGALGVRKPERRIFEVAAERAGATLDDGWMVGDNPEADIFGGRGAGLRTVWLSRGRTWERDDFAPDLEALDPASAIRQVVRPTDRE